jgi:diguanylate cyclase (GGDEF)-like protein
MSHPEAMGVGTPTPPLEFTPDHYVQYLSAKAVEADKLATLDPLTGLLNRRGLGLAYTKMVQSPDLRGEGDDWLLLVDMDNFKELNSRLSHSGGDKALVETAGVMRGVMRPQDAIGRWGGDEFAVLVDRVSQIDAIDIATRIKEGVSKVDMAHKLTVSIGVTAVNKELSFGEVIGQASSHLNEAKRQGKDRVFHIGSLALQAEQSPLGPTSRELF